jgi:hypothetical protein
MEAEENGRYVNRLSDEPVRSVGADQRGAPVAGGRLLPQSPATERASGVCSTPP